MRTVLEIDGLFDGTSAMSDAAVVIEDGEITWVGKRSRAPKTPKGQRSRSLKAGGSFALPGLINCHSHLTLDGSADFEAETRQSEAAAALKAFRNARLTLRSGVTTVRDLGAAGSMVVELSRQIERSHTSALCTFARWRRARIRAHASSGRISSAWKTESQSMRN